MGREPTPESSCLREWSSQTQRTDGVEAPGGRKDVVVRMDKRRKDSERWPDGVHEQPASPISVARHCRGDIGAPIDCDTRGNELRVTRMLHSLIQALGGANLRTIDARAAGQLEEQRISGHPVAGDITFNVFLEVLGNQEGIGFRRANLEHSGHGLYFSGS